MSIIQIIKEDDLELVKKEIQSYAPAFLKRDNKALIEMLGHDPFINSKFEINDFELDMSAEKSFNTDFTNVKLIYGNLKFLTPSQASDERLWAGLALTRYWEYTKYRWNIQSNNSTVNILNHFFFGYGKNRSLTRNAISRLWWIGKLTYDKSLENPFELTELLCRSSNYIQDGLERNISNNPEIILPFLKGVKKAEKDGFEISKNSFSKLAKYLNLLGGTYVLDVIPSNLIEEKIYSLAMKETQI